MLIILYAAGRPKSELAQILRERRQGQTREDRVEALERLQAQTAAADMIHGKGTVYPDDVHEPARRPAGAVPPYRAPMRGEPRPVDPVARPVPGAVPYQAPRRDDFHPIDPVVHPVPGGGHMPPVVPVCRDVAAEDTERQRLRATLEEEALVRQIEQEWEREFATYERERARVIFALEGERYLLDRIQEMRLEDENRETIRAVVAEQECHLVEPRRPEERTATEEEDDFFTQLAQLDLLRKFKRAWTTEHRMEERDAVGDDLPPPLTDSDSDTIEGRVEPGLSALSGNVFGCLFCERGFLWLALIKLFENGGIPDDNELNPAE